MKATTKIINILGNKFNGIINKFTCERGQIAVIAAFILIAVMGMMVLVIDEGSVYQTRRNLQTVADSAALAGVQELPENPALAVQTAVNYAALNNFTISSSDVIISGTYVNNDTITVTAVNPNTKLYFAGIFGQNSATVGANAKAIIGSPSEVKGVIPWGFEENNYTPGEEYTLKYGSPPDPGPGNFGALAIDGDGASVYRSTIINGATTPLSVGMWMDPQTGNVSGPTSQGTGDRIYSQLNNQFDDFSQLAENVGIVYKLKKGDSQFIIVPWVTSFGNGNQPVQILGFLQFIITYASGSVVKATFINKALIESTQDINPIDSSGLRVIRLIQ
ncbi:MAG: pilus assembly protein TadG-related protein [Actinobacteria bacterium]|nr:pilus assembly protein TadG-related protein [Actinomycetota bacterium]